MLEYYPEGACAAGDARILSRSARIYQKIAEHSSHYMRNIISLRNTLQFKEVYEKGRSKANGTLVVYVLANGEDTRKLGISVSKKVGNSVVRHRVTRRIRECFLKMQEELPAGYSYVVVARVRAAEKNFSEICSAFRYLVSQLVKL